MVLWLVATCNVADGLTVTFSPASLKIKEQQRQQVSFVLVDNDGPIGPNDYRQYDVQIADPDKARVVGKSSFNVSANHYLSKEVLIYNNSFTIEGVFLGLTKVYLLRSSDISKPSLADNRSNPLELTVTRLQSIISTIFIISVSILVSLNYINMGCALDLDVVKSVLRKPIAPAVGFTSQYVCMPLVSPFPLVVVHFYN